MDRFLRLGRASFASPQPRRASGTHYSSDARLPFVPGVDGTGITAAGERVYFFLPEPPYGGMAESCLVEDQHCIALPEGLDAKLAAAIAIPGMSSWAALVERAKLRGGETVLVNGATGTSGRLALQIAKHLGAKKVIATGRRPSDDLRLLGADVILQLVENRDVIEEAFQNVFRDGVDIVPDCLLGRSAETLMVAAARASPEGVPIRYVQIGSISGRDITLPSAALRSSSLLLMGSGAASVPLPRLLEAIKGVLQAAPSARLKAPINPVPLADISHAWAAARCELEDRPGPLSSYFVDEGQFVDEGLTRHHPEPLCHRGGHTRNARPAARVALQKRKAPGTGPPAHSCALRRAIVRLRPPEVASSWAG